MEWTGIMVKDYALSGIEHGVELECEQKWSGIAAVDRTLFCAPFDADGVLVIDADTRAVSTIACGVEGRSKWASIAAVDRTLFCAPLEADCVLVINADTRAARTIACGVEGAWWGLAPVDRTLFCAPFAARRPDTSLSRTGIAAQRMADFSAPRVQKALPVWPITARPPGASISLTSSFRSK